MRQRLRQFVLTAPNKGLFAEMNYREQDFNALNIAVRWLDKTHAKHAYEFACHYMATGSHNLHSDSVTNIIEHRITSDSVASHRLASHFPSDGTV
ncbi:hypothetical protein L9G74_09660 [Shewanella sp. C32]|uniref:Uncharacterized protein n=1 Tax=Shewanella electrica TaxID=515560 RepID=A0ABT2FK54_9GAMM|nr:hypothetical protein [Shewanella electrica]MCS4556706.1 hypothetical protein [Shewanella electrica]